MTRTKIIARDTLDTVIRLAQQNHQLSVTAETIPSFYSYLAWFRDTQHYDLNFGKNFNGHTPAFWITVDATLMYSYLLGQRQVRIDLYTEKSTLIDSKEKLPFLRSRGTASAFWPDLELYLLFSRREVANKLHSFPKYRDLFDHICNYHQLKEHWGQQLQYEKDVAVKKRR